MSGTAALPTDEARTICQLELYVGDRNDALFSQDVGAGERFAILVALPIAEPAFEHHAILRCPGYQAEMSRTFRLGEGWLGCRSVDLGEFRPKRSSVGR